MLSPERKFSKEFVDRLWDEGSRIPCDESNPTFANDELPPFYDKETFERGKQFIAKHYASIVMCNTVALIIGYADPTLSSILQFTSQFSTAKSSYKRFRTTSKHLSLWYEDDFGPGNPSWDSLKMIKRLHNSISKSVSKNGMGRFTQRDMAVTQLAFIIVLLNQEGSGVYDASDEDLSSFVHVWRNFGYVLGIENRFNICRESLAETKAICYVIYDRLFPVYSEKMEGSKYIEMVEAFVDGSRAIFPFFRSDYLLAFTKYYYFRYQNNEYSLEQMEIAGSVRLLVKVVLIIVSLFKYDVVRALFNHIFAFFLWLDRKHQLFAKFLKYN